MHTATTATTLPLRRTGLAALALGLATVALVAPASATPHRPTRQVDIGVFPSWWRPTPRPVVLTAEQRRDYWKREGQSGVLGQLSYYEISLLGQHGGTFDRNRDGRLLGNERRGWEMLLAAMRQYGPADTNGSGSLNPNEVRASAFFRPRVAMLDRTGDGRLDRTEVRDALLDMYRRGDVVFTSSVDCHGNDLYGHDVGHDHGYGEGYAYGNGDGYDDGYYYRQPSQRNVRY